MNKLDTTNYISYSEYKSYKMQKVFFSKDDKEKRDNVIRQYKKQIEEIQKYFKELDQEEKELILVEEKRIKQEYEKSKDFSKNFFNAKNELSYIIKYQEHFNLINVTPYNFVTVEKLKEANEVVKNFENEQKEVKELSEKKYKDIKLEKDNIKKQSLIREFNSVDDINDLYQIHINTLKELKALRKKQLKDIKNFSKILRNEYLEEIYNIKYRYYKVKEEIISKYPDKAFKNREHRYELKSSKVDETGKEVLLEVKNASVHFKVGSYTVKACNNLSFKVYKGETFGLVGESGSGKTTISRAIIGINKLTKGAIFFNGQNISTTQTKQQEKNNKKNIQMIFQDPAASLNERANVDYIISEGLYNFKMFKTKKERLKKVTNMIKEVGLLPEHLTRYPHEFSGGQRQRIGIARALVIEPQLVLADEPISALDVSIRAQVLNLLQKLQKERNLTYLFIAHDLSIIKYISDRIGVMHRGYMVELGSSDDIYQRPIHPYTRSLLTAIPQPDPITKNERVKTPFKEIIDYENCEWIEVRPNHFVLGTKELIKKWLKDEK